MITRQQAILARESCADVFTPDGDAAFVTVVSFHSDQATVIVSRTGDEKVYSLSELDPSHDLLSLEEN